MTGRPRAGRRQHDAALRGIDVWADDNGGLLEKEHEAAVVQVVGPHPEPSAVVERRSRRQLVSGHDFTGNVDLKAGDASSDDRQGLIEDAQT